MNNNIGSKVIVIKGASSGLGEAAARYLSRDGASVVLGARRFERIQAIAISQPKDVYINKILYRPTRQEF